MGDEVKAGNWRLAGEEFARAAGERLGIGGKPVTTEEFGKKVEIIERVQAGKAVITKSGEAKTSK